MPVNDNITQLPLEQLPLGLLAELADALQDDSDISPHEVISAWAEYMRSNEPDERNTLPELKQANDLLGRKIYDGAHAQYLRVVGSILGRDFPIPLSRDQNGGVKCEKYMQLSMDDRVNLMACCNGVAKCLAETQKRAEALDWLEEVNILDKNARFTKSPALYDWEYYNPQPPRQDYYLERINGLVGASDVFLGLTNTGCATQRRCAADELIKQIPTESVNIRPLRALCQSGSVSVLLQWRHPDPQLQNGWQVRDETLQVRGSWQKIKLSGNILPRMGFASFIWKSRLYVCGGMKGGEPTLYIDMHYMDLKAPGVWHELPPPPGAAFLNFQMVVHGDKAYSFGGRSQVVVFNLITERWGHMQTSWVNQSGRPAPWPQETNICDYAMHVVDGKIYVFGGTASEARMGCNFFAVLDLATKKWRHLSGFAKIPPADYDTPGPRKYAASWVDGKGEKIYLLQGMADREASEMYHQAHAARKSHGYDDFWSWDIKARRWRRERMVGNTPCPRTEMACTYNPVLDSTVVYGGYNPEVPTQLESKKCFAFTYYADTFVLDHSAARPRWRHVVHQGFPTYRAQSALLTDPDTGRMYLFGGFTNTDQVPSDTDSRTRSFRDLWELRLDVPGGHFDEVNLSDDRSARMGPWQKCFNCGNTGFWRKCGGTCNGRAFFCDEVCQREGWKEHKAFHKCRSRK